MDNINTIIGLISNVGFPIAAFMLMWRLTTSTIKENTEVLRQLKIEIKTLKNCE